MVLSDCSSNPGLQEQENEPAEFVHSCEHGDCRHSSISENKRTHDMIHYDEISSITVYIFEVTMSQGGTIDIKQRLN